MRINLTLAKQGFILIGVPLIFELVFIVVLLLLQRQVELQTEREAHSNEITQTASHIGGFLFEAGSAMVMAIGSQSPDDIKRYHDNINKADATVQNLRKLVKGNLREEKACESITEGIEKVKQLNMELGEGDPNNVLMQLMHIRLLFPELEFQVRKLEYMGGMIVKEERKISDVESTERARNTLKQFLLFGVALNILIAVILAVHFNKGTRARLATLMDNTGRLARSEQLNPQLQGEDEIARLDKVFHEMAEALDEAARRRKELDRLKREFVAMITHDLRTPLTGILFSAGLLNEGAYGEQTELAKEELKTVEGSVEQMLTLINDLLFVEKLEEGKMQLYFDNVELAAILERALKPLRPIAEIQKVKLFVPDTPAVAYADGDKLSRVIVNLVSNAIKFSPEGGEVRLEVGEQNGIVEVRVSDQGPGIPESSRQAIFDRFTQVDQKGAKEQLGTGLGLAICKEIIVQHGGTIGVECEDGKGSTFWFKIPRGNRDTDGAPAADG